MVKVTYFTPEKSSIFALERGTPWHKQPFTKWIEYGTDKRKRAKEVQRYDFQRH